MNNRVLGSMAIAVLVMGMIAWINQSGVVSPDGDDLNAVGGRVLPGLRDRLAEVEAVSFTSADVVTHIVRYGNEWRVEERDGYPADFERLATTLNGLADAELRERKTSKPENFAVLGVDNTSSVRVDIVADDQTFDLLMGKASTSGNGTFVRRPNEDQVWLAAGVDTVESQPASWIRSAVINIPSDAVMHVSMSGTEGSLDAQRDEESGDLVLSNLPGDAELKYDTIANTLARGLVNVNASDVRLRSETTWEDAARANYKLEDGSQVSVFARQEGKEYWLRFDADAVTGIDEGLLERFEYRVSEYVFGQFTQSLGDMIKAEETAEA